MSQFVILQLRTWGLPLRFELWQQKQLGSRVASELSLTFHSYAGELAMLNSNGWAKTVQVLIQCGQQPRSTVQS